MAVRPLASATRRSSPLADGHLRLLFLNPFPPVWLKRTGAEIRPAVEVAEVTVDKASGSVELLVACRHIADRGATLGGASVSRLPFVPTRADPAARLCRPQARS